MSKWTGRMPTRMINDRQIRPTEYSKWADAVRRFERREKDRQTLDWLKDSIPRDGLPEPIVLGISERHPDDVYVADGHHRAVALVQLGVREFPFHWYWIGSAGVRMEGGPFPYSTLGL